MDFIMKLLHKTDPGIPRSLWVEATYRSPTPMIARSQLSLEAESDVFISFIDVARISAPGGTSLQFRCNPGYFELLGALLIPRLRWPSDFFVRQKIIPSTVGDQNLLPVEEYGRRLSWISRYV